MRYAFWEYESICDGVNVMQTGASFCYVCNTLEIINTLTTSANVFWDLMGAVLAGSTRLMLVVGLQNHKIFYWSSRVCKVRSLLIFKWSMWIYE
mgnify:CR=1 FL=1